ncbi:aminoacetone oxidase family FAD-binding enzyme [Helicobacter sp. MIT 11-5569]|uniref:aminoacetone oxidase family FAD-binding enzyme n=1 Tax=Helicobacter sp. MIT 11-5569 TaxID=1548151 RepID=UPI0006893DB2|nr:aminoacetone oxidase family FAD-binding enzyme [Helicobacter sp. MIT 11-5569]TLD80333.1 aminoacetone oxidase family FAD-binding enzyme [Helicobacter sp. MIT 11-5569]
MKDTTLTHNNTQKVAIIGAGASGIFCAITLLQHNIPVMLFDKNKNLGKKLLATGNGRCNIHNQNTHANHYQTSSFNPKTIQNILQNFSFKTFAKTCQNLGIALEIQEDSKVYPLANSAKSVLEVFEDLLKNSKNLEMYLESEILELHKTQENFLLKSCAGEFICSCVVLACGSEAAPKLGGSDKGLQLAKNLGLKVIPTYPTLVPLMVESKLTNHLKGVKIKAKLTLKKDNQILKTLTDDVLFTDYGISGFGVLDISTHIKLQKDLKIILDFVPFLEEKVLENQLATLIKTYPNRKTSTLLSGFLHPKIAKAFAQNITWNPKNTKQLKQFVFGLKNFELTNPTLKGFENAEVSGGGVSGEEVNPNTLESKKHKNLYVIGEMLDVVGERGGYNLAFAWASAHICSKAILDTFK